MVDQTKDQASSLTEEEAEIYDRQIRLWGVEAQQRLRKAKILLVGLSSLGNEVAKNILLAGVKHMTLLDHTDVTEQECKTQFLTPFDMIGKNKAEACLTHAKELNPMVHIVADKDNIEQKSDDYFKSFDVICMTGCNSMVQVKVNEVCHRLGIKFLSANVFGYYGYMFADLGIHTYMEEQPKIKSINNKEEGPSSVKRSKQEDDNEVEIIEKVSSFCSLSDALSVKLFEGKSLRQAKQVSKTFLVMKVLHEYEKRHGHYPSEIKSQSDVDSVLESRNDVFEQLEVDNDLLQEDFSSYCVGSFYPVNAIIGGIMAQEVIKAVSGKDTPHNNFFFYDGVLTTGVVENISPSLHSKTINEEKLKSVVAPVEIVL